VGDDVHNFKRELKEDAIRVGRGPKNDVVLKNAGVSTFHFDVKPVRGSSGRLGISIKDGSTNGIGYRTSKNGSLERLDKGSAFVVEDAVFFLYIPFKVRAAEERIMVRVDFPEGLQREGQDETPVPVVEPAKTKKPEAAKAEKAEDPKKQKKAKEQASPAPAKPAAKDPAPEAGKESAKESAAKEKQAAKKQVGDQGEGKGGQGGDVGGHCAHRHLGGDEAEGKA